MATMPLAPGRPSDRPRRRRTSGRADLRRRSRTAVGSPRRRVVRRIARRAVIGKRVGPHTLRHAFITAALDAGVPLPTCKKPPVTPTAHDHALRPRTCAVPRSARHLHRGHLRRRRRPAESTSRPAFGARRTGRRRDSTSELPLNGNPRGSIDLSRSVSAGGTPGRTFGAPSTTAVERRSVCSFGAMCSGAICCPGPTACRGE